MANSIRWLSCLEHKTAERLVNKLIKSFNTDSDGNLLDKRVVIDYFFNTLMDMCWLPESIWDKFMELTNLQIAKFFEDRRDWGNVKVLFSSIYTLCTLFKDASSRSAICAHLSSLIEKHGEPFGQREHRTILRMHNYFLTGKFTL